jgi:hypothetical protein
MLSVSANEAFYRFRVDGRQTQVDRSLRFSRIWRRQIGRQLALSGIVGDFIPLTVSSHGLGTKLILKWTRPPRQLLNRCRMRQYRILLPLFGVVVALFIGRALTRGDLVERAPLGLHPHVGIAREHGARDVTRSLLLRPGT